MVPVLRILRLLALGLDIIGTILLVAAVLQFKNVLSQEMTIDDAVVDELTHEAHLEIAAIVLLIFAFLLLFLAEILESSPYFENRKLQAQVAQLSLHFERKNS